MLLLGLWACTTASSQTQPWTGPRDSASPPPGSWRSSPCTPEEAEEGWVYVAPDEAGVGSLEEPFGSLEQALAAGAERVFLLSGTHATPPDTEEWPLEQPLELEGACLEEVTLKGRLNTEQPLTMRNLRRLGGTWGYSDLLVEGCTLGPSADGGIALGVSPDSTFEVRDSHFEGISYVAVYNMGLAWVEDCSFENNLVAIYSEGERLTVRRVEVRGSTDGGVGVHSQWGHTLVEDSRFEQLEYGVWRSVWWNGSPDIMLVRDSSFLRSNVGSAGAVVSVEDVRIVDPVGPGLEVVDTSPDGFMGFMVAEDVEIQARDADRPAVRVEGASNLSAERLRVQTPGRGVEIEQSRFSCHRCSIKAGEVGVWADYNSSLTLSDSEVEGSWGLVSHESSSLRSSTFRGTEVAAAIVAPHQLHEARFEGSPIGLLVSGELPELHRASFEGNELDLWIQDCAGEPPETPEGLTASVCGEALELPK